MVDHNLVETSEEYNSLDEGFSVVGIKKGRCLLSAANQFEFGRGRIFQRHIPLS